MKRMVELAGGHRGELADGDKVWWVDECNGINSGEYVIKVIAPSCPRITADGAIVLCIESAGGINKGEVVHVFSTAVHISRPAGLFPVIVDSPRVGIIGYAMTEDGAIAVSSIYAAVDDKNYTVKRIKNYGRPGVWLLIEVSPELQDAWLLTEVPPAEVPAVTRFIVSITVDYATVGNNALSEITYSLENSVAMAIDEGLLTCGHRDIHHTVTVAKSRGD